MGILYTPARIQPFIESSLWFVPNAVGVAATAIVLVVDHGTP